VLLVSETVAIVDVPSALAATLYVPAMQFGMQFTAATPLASVIGLMLRSSVA